MPEGKPEIADDGCCGGGIGPVPYLLCTDCPRRKVTVDHEWLTVLNRRWCLGCSAFQSRHPQAGWMPYAGTWCPADTDYASRRDKENQDA